jgi:hypothetical protein
MGRDVSRGLVVIDYIQRHGILLQGKCFPWPWYRVSALGEMLEMWVLVLASINTKPE